MAKKRAVIRRNVFQSSVGVNDEIKGEGSEGDQKGLNFDIQGGRGNFIKLSWEVLALCRVVE